MSTNLKPQSSSSFTPVVADDHQVLLTGVTVPVFFLRPMLELDWVDPFSPSKDQVQVFTGFTVRLQ
jgi:hypothetical protein